MPFALVKVKGGYKVKNMESGRFYSSSPLTKDVAKRQLIALTISEYGLPPSGGRRKK